MSEKKRKQLHNASQEDVLEESVSKKHKSKKHKKEKENHEIMIEAEEEVQENDVCLKKKEKKKHKKTKDIVNNNVEGEEEQQVIEEITPQKKKSKKKRKQNLDEQEIEPKKAKHDNSEECKEFEKEETKPEPAPVIDDIQCDLMLNVADLPVKKPETKTKQQQKKPEDNYVEKPVGLVGVASKVNKKVSNGVQLGFKGANLSKTGPWNKKGDSSKKSYQHLIMGDIILGFKNCNLDEVKGYGL